MCLTVASKTVFFVRAVDSPSFYLECNKTKNLVIRGRHALNPVYDFMTARSRWRLVVIELFLAAGGFRTKSILLRKLERA